MAEFVNTVDVLGDDAVTDALIKRSITELTDDVVVSIGRYAFKSCINLTSVNFLLVKIIDGSAFQYCSKLTTINFPLATDIRSSAFQYCNNLTNADFPLVKSIDSNAFSFCTKLAALILRSTTMCTLSARFTFDGTPIGSGTGYIYVPRALVDSYKAATNWSTYAAQFRALEDYTVDGTITGELDSTKI